MKRTIICGLVASALCATPAGAKDSASVSFVPPSWNATDGAVIDFTVLRKGKPFGTHTLTFARDDDGTLAVTTDVDLQVKFGPITAFRYRLDSVENWVDGKLVALSGKSNNDGRKGAVSADVQDGALIVQGSKFDGALPLTTIPSSHWNRLQVYQDQMLSTETGEVLNIDVERLGDERLNIGGEAVEATRYRLTSDLTVDLWYDDQSRWVKLEFEVRGQRIEYVLNALY